MAVTRTIDMNADLGELPGDEGRASDRKILEQVSSCAIACGGHAGDDLSMAATLDAARVQGVVCGAHVAWPDPDNFGRKSLDMPLAELEASLGAQMRALKRLAAERDMVLRHVKPHGALYNDAALDAGLASAVVSVTIDVFGTSAAMICQPGFALAHAAREAGLTVWREAFIDRAYRADGTLRPRSLPGAVLETDDERIAQARQIVRDGCVAVEGGKAIALQADTLCLHGDSPGAAITARAVRLALEAAGFAIRAPEPER